MDSFEAQLEIIGINPFVFIPDDVLARLFAEADRSRGPIPIRGAVNGVLYQQTLVKYRGAWRMYINTSMLEESPKRVGETIAITVEFDLSDRSIATPKELEKALGDNEVARAVFDGLRPSLRKEIVRYIAKLKTDEAIDNNVKRAIEFLLGNCRFLGRDKP